MTKHNRLSLTVTWLQTASGGAERSTVELCRVIAEDYPADVSLHFLSYSGDTSRVDFDGLRRSGVRTHWHTTVPDYSSGLSQDIELSRSSHLLSSYRAFNVDIPIALAQSCSVSVIFRQTPKTGLAVRAIASSLAFEPATTRWDDMDWGLLSLAKNVVAVSDFTLAGLARFVSPERLRRIYNGVPLPPARDRTLHRKKPVFALVSRLVDWKRVDLAIEAFAEVQKVVPGAQLLVAGDGPERRSITDLIARFKLEPSVRLLGHVRDVAHVYRSADYLLHTCTMESFGRSVAEAAAYGVPGIVPSGGGPAEIVEHGHSGFVFASGDARGCAAAMIKACGLSQHVYNELCRNARTRTETHFSNVVCAKHYCEMITAAT